MARHDNMSTPRGIAVYPRLWKSDTKFDENGIYKADLRVPKEDAEPLMEELSELFKKHTGKAPKKSENSMWFFEEDEYGEETGNVIFKMRVKNKYNKKGEFWDRKPKQFDASKKPVNLKIGGGTLMIVSFQPYEWENSSGNKGVSLQPQAVQVLDLVEAQTGPTADTFGFGAQDGYVAPGDEGDDSGYGATAGGNSNSNAGNNEEDEEEDGDYSEDPKALPRGGGSSVWLPQRS